MPECPSNVKLLLDPSQIGSGKGKGMDVAVRGYNDGR